MTSYVKIVATGVYRTARCSSSHLDLDLLSTLERSTPLWAIPSSAETSAIQGPDSFAAERAMQVTGRIWRADTVILRQFCILKAKF